MNNDQLPVHRTFFVVSQLMRVTIDIEPDGTYVLEGTPVRSASVGEEILPTLDDLTTIYEQYGIYKRTMVDTIMAPFEALLGPLLNARSKNRQGWRNVGKIDS